MGKKKTKIVENSNVAEALDIDIKTEQVSPDMVKTCISVRANEVAAEKMQSGFTPSPIIKEGGAVVSGEARLRAAEEMANTHEPVPGAIQQFTIQPGTITQPYPDPFDGIKRKKHLERLSVSTKYPSITVHRVNYLAADEVKTGTTDTNTVADTIRFGFANNAIVEQRFYDACSFAAKLFYKAFKQKSKYDISDAIERGDEAFLILYVQGETPEIVVHEEGEHGTAFIWDFMDSASLLPFPVQKGKTPIHAVYGFVLHCADEDASAYDFKMTVFEAKRHED